MKMLNKLIKSNMSFEKITNEWLHFKKCSLKISTYYRYKYIIEKYLYNDLKSKKVIEMQKYDYNSFIEELLKRLSKKSVLDIIIVLKSILKHCERKYDIDLKIDLIPNITKNEQQIEILTSKEFSKLENYCLINSNYRNMGILISLYTGIRIGELCALQWKDIDFQKHKISISKTMQRIYTKDGKTFINIDTPKSKRSIRNVPIPTKLLNFLKEVKNDTKFSLNSYILTGSEHYYVEPRNLQYYFETILQKCGIKKYNFHVLRHTFASKCIQVGMDAKSLSELLGHSSVTITLNRYVHPSIKSKTKYLDKL